MEWTYSLKYFFILLSDLNNIKTIFKIRLHMFLKLIPESMYNKTKLEIFNLVKKKKWMDKTDMQNRPSTSFKYFNVRTKTQKPINAYPRVPFCKNIIPGYSINYYTCKMFLTNKILIFYWLLIFFFCLITDSCVNY